MEAHGCQIAQVQPDRVAGILDRTNFCFLFSQTYHPAMKHVASIRKEMGIPTVFNLLGPMSNPAKPKRVIVGVHSPEIGSLMANALKLTGVQQALVVCGAERLDEISPAGETHVRKKQREKERKKLTNHSIGEFMNQAILQQAHYTPQKTLDYLHIL